MLMMITLLAGLMLSQEPSQATVISAADLDRTMRESVAKNTLDKKVRETPVKGGIVRVGVVHRTSAEARVKVGPRDLVIMPAGVPHRFTQLDGPISYVIYRFEPVPPK